MKIMSPKIFAESTPLALRWVFDGMFSSRSANCGRREETQGGWLVESIVGAMWCSAIRLTKVSGLTNVVAEIDRHVSSLMGSTLSVITSPIHYLVHAVFVLSVFVLSILSKARSKSCKKDTVRSAHNARNIQTDVDKVINYALASKNIM